VNYFRKIIFSLAKIKIILYNNRMNYGKMLFYTAFLYTNQQERRIL